MCQIQFIIIIVNAFFFRLSILSSYDAFKIKIVQHSQSYLDSHSIEKMNGYVFFTVQFLIFSKLRQSNAMKKCRGHSIIGAIIWTPMNIHTLLHTHNIRT